MRFMKTRRRSPHLVGLMGILLLVVSLMVPVPASATLYDVTVTGLAVLGGGGVARNI